MAPASDGTYPVLNRLSRVLSILVSNKFWGRKPPQPVPFAQVIDRVKQAQAGSDDKHSGDRQRGDFGNQN